VSSCSASEQITYWVARSLECRGSCQLPAVFIQTTHAMLRSKTLLVEASWNAMAHAQKPDFLLRRNARVHLNRRGRQFSRLLAVEVSASAVVMLDTPCSEVVWRVLATHSIRQFPHHFPSLASPCAITFQLESTFFKAAAHHRNN